jgi:hypothetical protein
MKTEISQENHIKSKLPLEKTKWLRKSVGENKSQSTKI